MAVDRNFPWRNGNSSTKNETKAITTKLRAGPHAQDLINDSRRWEIILGSFVGYIPFTRKYPWRKQHHLCTV